MQGMGYKMCPFFQQNLPQPFQYFAKLGFNQQKLSDLESSLPYCLLKKVQQIYLIILAPEKYSNLARKFYHDHIMGTKGSNYKSCLIILGQYIQVVILVCFNRFPCTFQFPRNPFPKCSQSLGTSPSCRSPFSNFFP